MKYKIIFIILFSLIFSACSKPTLQDQNPQTTKSNSNDSAFTGSFKELLGKNDSIKCAIKSTGENLVDSGVYYIDGSTQKMRADIKTEVEEKGSKSIVNTSIIYDKNTMYSWSDNQVEGLKFTIDQEQINKDIPKVPNSPESNNEIIDMDSDMNLDCQKWTVDNSLFTPPSTIKFIDMQEKMKEVENFTKDMTGDMCKLCDMTTEDKNECQKMYCK